MKINSVSALNTNYTYDKRIKTPAFKSSFRSVYNDNVTLKYNTNTCFFRSDLKWADFVDYIDKKFQKINRVNIVNYACSTGEEPTSLAMILDMKLGGKANKFFPIKAYDIEEDNIKDAKRGLFKLNHGELELLSHNMGDKYNEYLNVITDNDGKPDWLSTKRNIESKVIYAQSDITKDLHKIPSKNTILLCRNFLPYLKIGDEQNLVKQIAKHLKPSSLIVLGKFEISYGIEKLFEKEGFVHTEQYNVMEKLPYQKLIFTKLMHKLKIK